MTINRKLDVLLKEFIKLNNNRTLVIYVNKKIVLSKVERNKNYIQLYYIIPTPVGEYPVGGFIELILTNIDDLDELNSLIYDQLMNCDEEFKKLVVDTLEKELLGCRRI